VIAALNASVLSVRRRDRRSMQPKSKSAANVSLSEFGTVVFFRSPPHSCATAKSLPRSPKIVYAPQAHTTQAVCPARGGLCLEHANFKS